MYLPVIAHAKHTRLKPCWLQELSYENTVNKI